MSNIQLRINTWEDDDFYLHEHITAPTPASTQALNGLRYTSCKVRRSTSEDALSRWCSCSFSMNFQKVINAERNVWSGGSNEKQIVGYEGARDYHKCIMTTNNYERLTCFTVAITPWLCIPFTC
jgi:hypothetical protein